MTKQWNGYDQPTQFSAWLRAKGTEGYIASKSGFVATNVDYMWENYKTGQWCLIEEKRFNAPVGYAQLKSFERLHKSISDHNYTGFYILRFENTSPEDGRVWLNDTEITEQELIEFLQFKRAYPSFW